MKLSVCQRFVWLNEEDPSSPTSPSDLSESSVDPHTFSYTHTLTPTLVILAFFSRYYLTTLTLTLTLAFPSLHVRWYTCYSLHSHFKHTNEHTHCRLLTLTLGQGHGQLPMINIDPHPSNIEKLGLVSFESNGWRHCWSNKTDIPFSTSTSLIAFHKRFVIGFDWC